VGLFYATPRNPHKWKTVVIIPSFVTGNRNILIIIEEKISEFFFQNAKEFEVIDG
jgi:hypothetical protein